LKFETGTSRMWAGIIITAVLSMPRRPYSRQGRQCRRYEY